MPDVSAVADEVANELARWPGIQSEHRADGAATVSCKHSELGGLYPDRAVAELPVLEREHDVLIKHEDAEPAEQTAVSAGISHSIHGPPTSPRCSSCSIAVTREDDPYSSQDPDDPQCRLDQL